VLNPVQAHKLTDLIVEYSKAHAETLCAMKTDDWAGASKLMEKDSEVSSRLTKYIQTLTVG
jgi:hypothetical protein